MRAQIVQVRFDQDRVLETHQYAWGRGSQQEAGELPSLPTEYLDDDLGV